MPSKEQVKHLRRISLEVPKRSYQKTLLGKAYDAMIFSGKHSKQDIREKIKEGKYPCHVCYSDGAYYNSNDFDPIEGYKMASKTMKCSYCDGTGFVSKEKFKKWAAEKEKQYKLSVENHKKMKKFLEETLPKFSDQEIIMLNEHFCHSLFFNYEDLGEI